jgi:hypothetical protein
LTHGIDLDELYQKEKTARENYMADFVVTDPRPLQPARFSVKDLGIEFPLTVITGLAAIIQAAMRTGYKFFELASKQGMGVASWLDGASAMIGVEGFIAVIAFTQARARGKGKVQTGNAKLSLWREIVGAGVALSISIAAGFAQSITGSKYIPESFQAFVDWLVLIALGLGASVLAYFAGEIAGAMVVRAEALYVSGVRNFKSEDTAWAARFKEAWEGSDQYQLLHVDIHGAAKLAKAGYRIPKGATGVRSAFTPPNERPNEKALKVLAYLDEHATPEFVPGATEVAAACGVSKSYASEVTKGWIAANPPEKRTGALHNGHQPQLELTGNDEAADASG